MNELRAVVEPILEKLGLMEWRDQVLDAEFTELEDGRLVKLDLGLTQAKILPSDAFQGLTDIDMLNLSAMGLEELPSDIFHTLPNLRVLGLTNNNLRHIDSSYFELNPKLELVSLNGNPLDQPLELEGVRVILD